jgi:hypothetical protein
MAHQAKQTWLAGHSWGGVWLLLLLLLQLAAAAAAARLASPPTWPLTPSTPSARTAPPPPPLPSPFPLLHSTLLTKLPTSLTSSTP